MEPTETLVPISFLWVYDVPTSWLELEWQAPTDSLEEKVYVWMSDVLVWIWRELLRIVSTLTGVDVVLVTYCSPAWILEFLHSTRLGCLSSTLLSRPLSEFGSEENRFWFWYSDCPLDGITIGVIVSSWSCIAIHSVLGTGKFSCNGQPSSRVLTVSLSTSVTCSSVSVCAGSLHVLAGCSWEQSVLTTWRERLTGLDRRSGSNVKSSRAVQLGMCVSTLFSCWSPTM